VRKWSGGFQTHDMRPDVGVQCPRKSRGCTWKGDFRQIPFHENECMYGDAALLKELCRRMDQWEVMMQTREKDISLLKYNLNEVREALTEKQMEIDALTIEMNKM